MNFDRNTVIGFVLFAILLFAYLFISTKNNQQLAAENNARRFCRKGEKAYRFNCPLK